MEKDLVEGNIGKAKYDVEFRDGKLVAELKYAHDLAEAGAFVHIPADSVLDAIAKAIPGQIDDAVIELIKKALKQE